MLRLYGTLFYRHFIAKLIRQVRQVESVRPV
jgi:hypothetical protein